MQRRPPQQPYQPVNQGYPVQTQAAAYGYGNNNGEDMPNLVTIGAYLFALLGTAAFIWLIVCAAFTGTGCGWKGNGNGLMKVFGEISIDQNGTGSVPLEFLSNSSHVELDSYQQTHGKGVIVNASEGYIMTQFSGEYWYELHLSMRFDEHWLPWTPWRLYVGVDNKKVQREGFSQDILWWASNETFWSYFPIPLLVPYSPADMTLSGIIRLEEGQKMSAFLGIPDFCFNCPFNEAMIHGPASVTIDHATVSMHMLSPASILQASTLLILLAILSF